MSFYDQIDKRKTIRKAKIVLGEYNKFLKIIKNAYNDMTPSRTFYSDVARNKGIPYIRYDTMLINNINNKDRQYDVLVKYIAEIQKCINLLNLEEIEIINLRYVEGLNIEQICERFKVRGYSLSERQIKRVMRECYIDFAITYGVFVLQDESKS